MLIVQIIFLCRKQQNNNVNSTRLYRILIVIWTLSTSTAIKHVINRSMHLLLVRKKRLGQFFIYDYQAQRQVTVFGVGG